jgi:UDP-N-acetylglucosamine--N-acetylmuramyl-(pentapeptide) pyrophosphoryl-undecaprenol N-acetylglucosamine transferase
VVPALAVADALRAEGAEVAFIGAGRAEAKLVPEAGFELHTISVEGLSRSNPLRALRALVRAAIAVSRARSLLKGIAPDVVMGGGGYVAAPVVLAALSRRIPVLLTEADSQLGLTNRLLAPFARRVCLAFPLSSDVDTPAGGRSRRRARRRSKRYLVTGRPIPPPSRDRYGARERLGIGPDETCVVVFGGSLGARSINRAATEAFTGSAFHVLHVAGRREYQELAKLRLAPGYDLRDYLAEPDFTDALAAADLAVARAGGSVFEIAAHGVPAILVPYPHAAGDHQRTNARWMSDAGAAIVISDSELTPTNLARRVAGLLSDRSALAAMGSASKALARPEAASEVAHQLLLLAGSDD